MKSRLPLALMAASASLLGACVTSSPAPVPPVSSPSVAPAAPSATPSVAASALPSVAPSAATGIDWASGQVFKSYDFEAVAGIHFNPYLNQFIVLDAEGEAISPRRYLARKFQADGTYVSTVDLAPEGRVAPDAVDGVTFDASGTPVYAYRNDGAFSLLKLVTSTVVAADRYPLDAVEWAGPSALRADGVLLHVALLNLDPDKRDEARRMGRTPDMLGGTIYYATAEEDEPPKALFQVADPFVPTRAMAFSSSGDLYLAGQTSAGGFALKRLTSDQSIVDVAALPARPEAMWARPEGGVYLAWEVTGAPARIAYVDTQSTLQGETEIRLKDGGFLAQVEGLTFDNQRRPVMTASGFDAAGRRVSGMFTFTQ
jgi:hypothetical protein